MDATKEFHDTSKDALTLGRWHRQCGLWWPPPPSELGQPSPSLQPVGELPVQRALLVAPAPDISYPLLPTLCSCPLRSWSQSSGFLVLHPSYSPSPSPSTSARALLQNLLNSAKLAQRRARPTNKEQKPYYFTRLPTSRFRVFSLPPTGISLGRLFATNLHPQLFTRTSSS